MNIISLKTAIPSRGQESFSPGMCDSPQCTRHISVVKCPPLICWGTSGIQSSHSCCYAPGLVLPHHIHDPIWKKTGALPIDQSDCVARLTWYSSTVYTSMSTNALGIFLYLFALTQRDFLISSSCKVHKTWPPKVIH